MWNSLLRNSNVSVLGDNSWIILLIYSEELSKRVAKRKLYVKICYLTSRMLYRLSLAKRNRLDGVEKGI